MNPMRNRKAFTLIELLVVIAIIALLLSIVMPALRKAKLLALTVICRSNLHQWAISAKMYTNEYDDSFQGGWGGNRIDSNWWLDAWRVYYGNIDEIRCCPYATKVEWNLDGTEGPGYDYTPQTAWGIDNGNFLTRGDYGSYGINGWVENPTDELAAQGGIDGTNNWRKSTALGGSIIPLLTDAKWIDFWPEPDHSPPPLEDTLWGGTSHFTRLVQNRHDERQNMSFLDLSVARVGLKQLWTLKWHTSYNTGGPWTAAGGAVPADWPPWMEDFKTY